MGPNDRLKGGFIFGPTDFIPDPPREAYLPVKTSNGDTYMVPKIFYSKFNSDSNFKGNIKTPDFTNPFNLVNDFLSTGGKAVKTDNTLGGIYVPMPFGISPLAVQLMNQDDFDDGGNIGLGLNSPDKFTTTSKPDLLMKALRGALDYLNNRQNSNPSYPADQSSFVYDINQQNQQIPLNAFSIDQSPYSDYLVQTPPLDQTSLRSGNLLEKSVDGISRPDFVQRLTSNLVQALSGQENQQSKQQIKPLNQTASLGGFRDDKVFTKATGMFLSLPFLPSSYLGSYVNYDKSNKTTFG